jgi:hypothetical protein
MNRDRKNRPGLEGVFVRPVLLLALTIEIAQELGRVNQI